MNQADKSLLSYQQQSILTDLIDKHQINNKNTKLILKYYHHFIKTLYYNNNHITKITNINNIHYTNNTNINNTNNTNNTNRSSFINNNTNKSTTSFNNNTNSSFIKTLLQIALIFTQKSNFYRTIQGQQFPGISFSIHHILQTKSYSEIHNLTYLCQQLLNQLKFKQSILKQQLYQLIHEINKGLQQAILFQKLSLTFYENTLQSVTNQSKLYKQKLITFSWYLYLDLKYYYFNSNHKLYQQNYYHHNNYHHNNYHHNNYHQINNHNNNNDKINNDNDHKINNIVTKKFLMISILQTIVLNSLSHITPLILQKNSTIKYNSFLSTNSLQSTSINNKKQLMSTILSILLQSSNINIKSQQLIQYQSITQSFNHYFDHLINSFIIKSTHQNHFDFLSPSSLDINLRKLDKKISKQISSHQIDLRKLISYQLSIETHHKKTAIEDKLIIKHKKHSKSNNHSYTNQNMNINNNINNQNNQNSNQNNQNIGLKKYKSHRVLDLDNCQIQMNSSSIITQSQINLPSNIIQQPIPRISIPGLHIINEKDQLTKYLLQKTKPYIQNVNQYQQSIITYIQNAFHQFNQRPSLSSNHQFINQPQNQNFLLAYQFYTYLSQQVWNSQSQSNNLYILEQSDSTHQCLLIIALGAVLLSLQDFENTHIFVKLVNLLKPDLMNFFYSLMFMQDINMPSKLKISLKNCMKTIINDHIWTDNNFIEQINNATELFLNNNQSINQKTALSCILQRAANYISQKTQFISTDLSKDSSLYNETQFSEWKTKSLELSLTLMTYSPQLVYERSLDQLILCSLYGTSKLLKMAIRFHQLIQTYKKSTSNKSYQFEKTILNVKSSINSSSIDIIEFYNTQFIGYLNFGFDLVADRNKMQFILLICGQCCQDDVYISPFRYTQQTLLLSPKLNKSKSQIRSFKSIPRSTDKQNIDENTNHSININLEHDNHTGYYSYRSTNEEHHGVNSSNEENKILINFEINSFSSRNPTRIKERRTIEEREEQLCVTQKTKHPIFTELRNNEEE